jgi:hypothetical protein
MGLAMRFILGIDTTVKTNLPMTSLWNPRINRILHRQEPGLGFQPGMSSGRTTSRKLDFLLVFHRCLEQPFS